MSAFKTVLGKTTSGGGLATKVIGAVSKSQIPAGGNVTLAAPPLQTSIGAGTGGGAKVYSPTAPVGTIKAPAAPVAPPAAPPASNVGSNPNAPPPATPPAAPGGAPPTSPWYLKLLAIIREVLNHVVF